MLKQSVGKRTFAVVDVRNDTKVANVLRVDFGHAGFDLLRVFADLVSSSAIVFSPCHSSSANKSGF